MDLRRGKELVRSVGVVTLVTVGILLLAELTGWLLVPDRYGTPPAVTAEAWVFSDALGPTDIVWMKEFVEEFCQSYTARWSSYVYFRRKPFSGRHINVDSNGIRYTPQFAAGKTSTARPARIFLLGGSTMWGTGARDSNTIPSHLARVIARDPCAGPASVVNMGESGYVSTQGVLRLELELQKGNIPDIVLLYDGVNDVFSTYQNRVPGLPQNEGNRVTEFDLLKEGGRMRRLGVEDLMNRTVAASLVNTIRSALRGIPPPVPPPMGLAGEVVRIYRGNLEIMEALSKQFGFRFEAYWQPVVFSKKKRTAYEERQTQLQQIARPFFEEVYRRVREDPFLCSYPRFHDLSDVFDRRDGGVFLDFCHITEAGNAAVAEKMFADIRPFLRAPR